MSLKLLNLILSRFDENKRIANTKAKIKNFI